MFTRVPSPPNAADQRGLPPRIIEVVLIAADLAGGFLIGAFTREWALRILLGCVLVLVVGRVQFYLRCARIERAMMSVLAAAANSHDPLAQHAGTTGLLPIGRCWALDLIILVEGLITVAVGLVVGWAVLA